MMRNPSGTPRDRRIWTGGMPGSGVEFYVPGDIEGILRDGLRMSVMIIRVPPMPGVTDFAGRKLTGLQLTVSPVSGAPYRADVALYVPPEAVPILNTGVALPGRVSHQNKYALAIEWDVAIARASGIDVEYD